jgi:hypothetical protein
VSGQKVTQNCDAPHKRVNKRVNKRGSRLTSLRSRQGFLGRQATLAALPSQEVVCQEHEHIVSTDRLERASARSVPLQFRSSKCCFLVHACGESRYKKNVRRKRTYARRAHTTPKHIQGNQVVALGKQRRHQNDVGPENAPMFECACERSDLASVCRVRDRGHVEHITELHNRTEPRRVATQHTHTHTHIFLHILHYRNTPIRRTRSGTLAAVRRSAALDRSLHSA